MRFNLPSLKALRAVEAVGRHGSITSAANELRVTPGAISRHISLLEDYFDCKLFRRHGKGLALTEVGQGYVQQLHEAFGLIDRASSKILRISERRSLVIRVLGAFATEWLLPRIVEFEELHPDVDVTIRAQLSGVDFDTDDADLGIIGSKRKPRGVESVELYLPYLTPIISPALAKKKPAIREPNDLKHFRLLHAMNIRPTWDQWLSKVSADHDIDTKPGHWLERSTQLNQAVRRGAGVALGQHLLIGEELINGTLLAPLNEWVPSSFPLHIVWPSRHKSRTELQLFVEWLVEGVRASEKAIMDKLPNMYLVDGSN